MSSTASGPSSAPQLPAGAASTAGESESSAPRLEGGVDLGILKEVAREGLVELLNSVQGAKTLVLDPAIAGPLGLITDISLLKHQAVDKLFWLEAGPLVAPTRNIVYLCAPRPRFMRIIAEHIRGHQADGGEGHTYTLILAPRATALCKRALEDEGISGDVVIREYRLEWVPRDEDVLSLEGEGVARDIWLNGDDTPLYNASRALMTFQRAYGLFPRIIGKGDASRRLATLLHKHRRAEPALYGDLDLSTQVDGLIVLDRAVDWMTPMCTQLTYEGLVDEFIGIKNGNIEVDPALLSTSKDPPPPPQSTAASAAGSTSLLASQPKKKKHPLNASSDRLLGEIRDLNFAVVGSRLSRTARRLEGDYEGRKNLKSVKEMKDFVGRLGGLQSEHQGLRLHTGLSEILMPITRSDEFSKTLEIQQNLIAGYDVSDQFTAIEDLLAQQAPMSTVLRAAVLYSLTAGGIKPKQLEAFKREFLQVYGYHHIPLLMALAELDLLTKAPPRNTNFPALRKALRLLVDDIDEQAPTDISYVYSGYAPLSIRLVQCIAQKPVVLANPVKEGGGVPKAHGLAGWKGFEDVVRAIPGAMFDEVQQAEEDADTTGRAIIPHTAATTVVFFLGGCTYTEIAALRWMSSQTKGRRFLIATTGIINGSNLLAEFGLPDPVELKPTA